MAILSKAELDALIDRLIRTGTFQAPGPVRSVDVRTVLKAMVESMESTIVDFPTIDASEYGMIGDHPHQSVSGGTEVSVQFEDWIRAVEAGVKPGAFIGGNRMHQTAGVLVAGIGGDNADDFTIRGRNLALDYWYITGSTDDYVLKWDTRFGIYNGDILGNHTPAWDVSNPSAVRVPTPPPQRVRTLNVSDFSIQGLGTDNLGNSLALQHGLGWIGQHDKLNVENVEIRNLNGTAFGFGIAKETLYTHTGNPYSSNGAIRESVIKHINAYRCGRSASSYGAGDGHPAIVFGGYGPGFGVNFLAMDTIEASVWRGDAVVFEYEGIRLLPNGDVAIGINSSHAFSLHKLKTHGTGPVADPTSPPNSYIKLATSLANANATVPIVIDLTTIGTGTHTITSQVTGQTHNILAASVDTAEDWFYLGEEIYTRITRGEAVTYTATGTPPAAGLVSGNTYYAVPYFNEFRLGLTQPTGHPLPASGRALVIRGETGNGISFLDHTCVQAAWEDPDQYAINFVGVNYSTLTYPPINETRYPRNVTWKGNIATCQNGILIAGGGGHKITVDHFAGIRGYLVKIGQDVITPCYLDIAPSENLFYRISSAPSSSHNAIIVRSKMGESPPWTWYQCMTRDEATAGTTNTVSVANVPFMEWPTEVATYQVHIDLTYSTTAVAGFAFALHVSDCTVSACALTYKSRPAGAAVYTETTTITLPTAGAPATFPGSVSGQGGLIISGTVTVSAVMTEPYIYVRYGQATADPAWPADPDAITKVLAGSSAEIKKLHP